MYKHLSLAAAVLALTVGAAAAQSSSSSSSTTTTTQPPVSLVVPPPIGTLSTEHTSQTVNPDGSQSSSKSTTYRNTEGVANDSVTRSTTTPAPLPMETTTHHSSTTTTPN